MSDFKKYLNAYVFESEMPSDGSTVKYKPITTGQIKKLLLYEASDDANTIEDALDDLIEECVVSPADFDVKSIYLQDRFYLLVEIRRATKGSKYTFETACPKCESQTFHSIDLGSLTVRKLERAEPKVVETIELTDAPEPKAMKKKGPSMKLIESGKEPKKVEIITSKPVDTWNVIKINDNISIRTELITRNTQLEAQEILTNSTKGLELSDIQKAIMNATITNALCIKSVITPAGEEEVSLEDKIYLLDNLTQTEMEYITNWFEQKDFGLDFSIPAKCAQCGNEDKRDIPLDSFFY